MKKILAFGASNSKASINHQLAVWAANQLEDAEVTEVHLNDFEMPLYSIDREMENGIPARAQEFKQLVKEADGLLISFAEHNGSFSVAFKNIFDWISRISKPIWEDKPMMIMATSPGPRGGQSVLKTAQDHLPFRGVKINGVFSLPSFGQNFAEGVIDPDLKRAFEEELEKFKRSMNG